jgi:antitoxin component YwqK of YwqJK toxin-antitoxin module
MNRLLLVFMLFGMSFLASGQDSINRTDVSGKKQGVWEKVDKDGHKLYDGQFRDGVPNGEFRYYYADGKLKAISVLSDDGKTARTISYALNGRKIAEGNFRNEKKDSLWKYYSDFDGVLLSIENYTLGVKNGVSKTYYPNGNLIELINYREGRKEGEWVQYFEDGKPKFRGAYAGDEKEGPFTAYYSGGKISFSGAYKAGHMDGIWTFYDENGDVTRVEKYSEGAMIKEKTP